MTKKATFKLYKAAELDKRITLLHKSGQRLQTEMHKLACSVLAHVGEHKDIRVVMKFIAAMPEMSRTNGLRNWFTQFGPVKFVTVGEGKDAVEQIVFVKDKATKLGDAIDKPFWKFSAKEGTPYEAIDLTAYVNQQIKRLEKDAKETNRDHSAIIKALKASLEQPAAQ